MHDPVVPCFQPGSLWLPMKPNSRTDPMAPVPLSACSLFLHTLLQSHWSHDWTKLSLPQGCVSCWNTSSRLSRTDPLLIWGSRLESYLHGRPSLLAFLKQYLPTWFAVGGPGLRWGLTQPQDTLHKWSESK